MLPTLITLGNGTCGLVSIAVLTTAQQQLGQPTATFYAAVLIYLGMLLDSVDGYVARAAKQTSEFGVQLDSSVRRDHVRRGAGLYHAEPVPRVSICGSSGASVSIFSLCVVLRLARYNVEAHEGESHGFFRGLPSPAAAGTVASFGIAMPSLMGMTDPSMPAMVQQTGRWAIDLIVYGTPLVTLLLACLMVSRIRYPHLLHQLLHSRRNFYSLAQLVFVIVAVVTFHELALPLLFCLFAFSYPVTGLCRKPAPLPRPRGIG